MKYLKYIGLCVAGLATDLACLALVAVLPHYLKAWRWLSFSELFFA